MAFKAYVIQKGMVGPHMVGEVVHWTDDQIKKGGHNVERLLRLGVVREATDKEGNGVEYGQNPEADFSPIPPVAFESHRVLEESAGQPTTTPPPDITPRNAEKK